MTLPRQLPVTSASIGDITVELFDPNPNPLDPTNPLSQRPQSAKAIIQVTMSDGSTRIVEADIPTYFSATVVNQLRAFVASVRTKANTEILGG